jgi:hypothetical protein
VFELNRRFAVNKLYNFQSFPYCVKAFSDFAHLQAVTISAADMIDYSVQLLNDIRSAERVLFINQNGFDSNHSSNDIDTGSGLLPDECKN